MPGPEALYHMSVLSFLCACLVVMGLMCHRLLQARRQKVPSDRRAPIIPGSVIWMCRACLFLFVVMALLFLLEWVNVTFHFRWNSGRWRNFIMAPTALTFGVVLWRNFGRLLQAMHFERLPGSKE